MFLSKLQTESPYNRATEDFIKDAVAHNSAVLTTFARDHALAHDHNSKSLLARALDILTDFADEAGTSPSHLIRLLRASMSKAISPADAALRRDAVERLRRTEPALAKYNASAVRKLFMHADTPDVFSDGMCVGKLCRATRHGASDTLIAQRLAAHLWMAHERIVAASTAGSFGLQTRPSTEELRYMELIKGMAVIDRKDLERLVSHVRAACKTDPRALDVIVTTIRGCHTYNDLSLAISDGTTQVEHIAERMARARGHNSRRNVINALGSMVSDKVMSSMHTMRV